MYSSRATLPECKAEIDGGVTKEEKFDSTYSSLIGYRSTAQPRGCVLFFSQPQSFKIMFQTSNVAEYHLQPASAAFGLNL